MKIDPANITDFNRSEGDLERFLIFCICVAGKNSKMVANKLNEWWVMREDKPLLYMNRWDGSEIKQELMKIRIGQYTRIGNALFLAAALADAAPLSNVSVQRLEWIKGIGPKTARFFVLHSRPNQRLAVLDTHILRYMRENGIADTPKSTPSGEKYLRLEKIWLEYCDRCGKTSSELDLEVWKAGRDR